MNKLLIFLAILTIGCTWGYLQYPSLIAHLLQKIYQLMPAATMKGSISDKEKKEIITRLNNALADEWFAYYQYWLGAFVTTGPLTKTIKDELNEHAGEEFKHANMLATRIIELGGTPLLGPNEWQKQTNCGYLAPINPQGNIVLQQNIDGEICAIKSYTSLLSFLEKKDPITHAMVTLILADEVKHEKDLKKILAQL